MCSARSVRLILGAALCAAAAPLLFVPLGADKPLADRVVIRRDTFGVPHITGETEAAVAFGFGYAQAEDHAEEMAKRFLAARGEAAKHLGPSFLDNDLAMRRADNLGESRRALGVLDRRFREVLEGFAGGYNLYVQQRRATLPAWVPEITAADALAMTHTDSPGDAASASIIRALQQKYSEGSAAPKAPGPVTRTRLGRVERARTLRPQDRERRAHAARQPAPALAAALLGGARQGARAPRLLRLDAGGLPLAARRIQRPARLRADQQQLRQPRHLRAAAHDDGRAPYVLALAPGPDRPPQLDDGVRLSLDRGGGLALV